MVPPSKKKTSSEAELIRTIKNLEKTISELPEHYAYIFHPGKSLFIAFIKGIMYGLGILIAIALVVPFIISVLQSVEWVPLIGDFLVDIAARIELQAAPRSF